MDSITRPLDKKLKFVFEPISANRTYSSFCSMKGQGVLLLPTGWAPQHLVMLPQQFASIHLYSWMERGAVKGKCFAQEHNT